MRHLKIAFLLLFLWGCTSQKSQFKELATQLAEKEKLAILQKEADSYLQHSAALHEGYIKSMSQKSEITVKEIDLSVEGQASAQIYIELPSVVIRQALLGVASRVDTTRSRRFNFSEAMGLLKKEMKIKPENLREKSLRVYRFKKTAEGWTVLNHSN